MSPLTPGVRAQLATLTADFKARPTDAVANVNLARALLAYELYGSAEGYLRRASALNPQDLDSVYLLGWVHALVGKRDEALADFDRALRLRPDHPQTMLRRADLLRRMDKLREAEQAFRRILKIYPDQPTARFGLGNVLLASGQYQDAIGVLRALVTAYDWFGAAHYTLALAYRKVGDEVHANGQFAAYQASRTWEPQFEDPVLEQIKDMNRGHQRLFERSLKSAAAGNWAQAAELLEEATSEDPNFLVGHVNLITCYAHLGNAPKVEEHYRKALALSPASAELQNTQGLVSQVSGRFAEARAHFLKAIESDPSHYSSHENLGLLSFEAEAPLKAVAEIARDVPARLALADYYIDAKRTPEALSILQAVAAEKRGLLTLLSGSRRSTIRRAERRRHTARWTACWRRIPDMPARSWRRRGSSSWRTRLPRRWSAPGLPWPPLPRWPIRRPRCAEC